jgi:hypothetical protein
MTTPLAVTTRTLVAALLVCAAGPGIASADADPPFSAAAVFALPDHRYVYDDCPDARKFADAAAANGLAAVSASDGVAGANAFLRCYRIRRLNPDPDQLRYLALAAGAALYDAATKSSGAAAIALLNAADSIDEQLGAPTPDHSIVIDKVEVGTSSAGRNSMSPEQALTNAEDSSLAGHSGPPHTTYVIKRDPFGESHLQKYGDIATAMRLAVAVQVERLHELEQARETPAPTSAPHP